MPTVILRRAALVAVIFAAVAAVALLAGPRQGLLLLIGFGFGALLEGLSFGFAGPWRRAVMERDTRGLQAHLAAIALTALAVIPLIALRPGEIAGAVAPVGTGMIVGAFLFGIAMQLVVGCGSGTLVNAGSGNALSLAVLPFFVIGTFLGTAHVEFWRGLGELPELSMQGLFGPAGGPAVTVALLAMLGLWLWRRSPQQSRRWPRTLVYVVLGLAALAVLHVVVAGQPWGVVYGLGLVGAKLAGTAGVDVVALPFWARPANAARLEATILTDVTSITNIGIVLGAACLALWKREPAAQIAGLLPRGWLILPLAGLLLGYSARMAYGCNVGAFFSGISSGSLHGWVWLPAALAGTAVGARLRFPLGLAVRAS